MNNGRMTFRFDDKQDKLKPKTEERWSGSSLGTATDYTSANLREEAGLLEPTWPVDSDFRFTEEEPTEVADTYYSIPADPRPQHFEVHNQLPLLPTDSEVDRYITQPLGNDRISQGYENILQIEDDYGGSYHSRRPSYWWKFALSVAGAVVTGVLLGYVALSFFNGGNAGTGAVSTTGSTATQEQTAALNTDSAKTGTSGTTGTESAGMNRIPVQVAAQNYYLLQYGVFSTSAGAVQAQQELLDAGLAAALDPTDGNRVYAGLSPDREQAKLLSSGLKNQGIELYVRQVTLPAEAQLAFAGNAEAVNNYFSVSGQLLAELASLSASLLSATPANAAADTTQVSDLHMQWTEAAKTLEQGLSPEAQRICAELEKSMSQGISALNEYNKNTAKGLLWEVQESMLSFLTGQRQLLSALG